MKKALKSIIVENCEAEFINSGIGQCYQSNEKFSFENNLLEKAFNLLSDSHRRVLEMLYFEGKTPAQIALEMNCTKQNVYNQKSRAIKFMRGYMGKLDE